MTDHLQLDHNEEIWDEPGAEGPEFIQIEALRRHVGRRRRRQARARYREFRLARLHRHGLNGWAV